MTSPRKPKSPPDVDRTSAKAAFEAALPRAQVLPKEQLITPNTAVDAAAIAALGVAREVNEPSLRERFESLPKAEFDVQHLDDLPIFARAAWYSWTELLSASAASTDAKLPLDLVEESTGLRADMIKVITYHFDPSSLVGRELADILLGSGYRDLANDLMRLSKLYGAQAAELADDKRHYRATDADRAEALALRILDELGAAKSVEQRHWTEMVARTWTLLLRVYKEVAATGNWLRRNEAGVEPFGSLVAAGRTSKAKPRKTSSEDESPPPEPATGDKGDKGE
jgi:hypothetical protein